MTMAAGSTGQPLRILILTGYYLPGYKAGGPVRTLGNLAGHLGGEFDLRVLTRDRDSLDAASYQGVTPNTWTRVGQAQVFYLTPGPGVLGRISRIIRSAPHDLLYLNSLFDPLFTVWPLLLRRLGRDGGAPALIAPRGECAPPALDLNRWKKAPYRRLARLAGLYRDLTWQASSPREAAAISRVMNPPPERILVAPNLATPGAADAPAPPWPRRNGPLRVLYLARITPMKNLVFALGVLARVRVPLEVTIHGPVDDPAYWRHCQGLLGQMPPQVRVHYAGPMPHDQVAATLARHDLFFLPSRGESFGHVILEALIAGTPVLIADTTPWRGLAHHGVGWDLPLGSEAAWISCIHAAAAQGEADYARWRARVLAFARARIADPAPVAATRRLLYQAAGRPAVTDDG